MKKLISIILTACICLSLLGGISFAGAADTATEITFDFTSIVNGSINASAKTLSEDSTKADWGWIMGTRKDSNVGLKNYGIQIKGSKVGDYVAFAINVPVGGTYEVDYYHYNYAGQGGYADVYIYPGIMETFSIDKITTDGIEVLSEVKHHSEFGTGNHYYSFAYSDTPITLSAGKHTLVFYLSKAAPIDSAQYRMFPTKLILTTPGARAYNLAKNDKMGNPAFLTVNTDVWDTELAATGLFEGTIVPLKDYGCHGFKYLDADNKTYETAENTNHRALHFHNDYLRVLSEGGTGVEGNAEFDNGTAKLALALEKPSKNPNFYSLTVNTYSNSSNAAKAEFYASYNDDVLTDVDDCVVGKNKIGDTYNIEPNGSYILDELIYSDGVQDLAVAFNTGENGTLSLTSLALDPVNVSSITLDAPTTLEVGKTSTVKVMAEEKSVVDSFVTYTVTEETDVIDIAPDGTVTAKAVGTATITATVGEFSATATIEVTEAPVEEPEDEPEEAPTEINYGVFVSDANCASAVTANGTKLSETTDGFATGELAPGTTLTATAEDNVPGYKFRYWVLGSAATGRYYSSDNTVTVTPYANIALTAIYTADSIGNVVDLFNYNGEFLQTLTNLSDLANVQPTMIGHTFANKWLLADKTELKTDTVLTTPVTQAVAQYTKNSGYEAKNVNEDSTYGWTRNGKLVTYDEDYTFLTWLNEVGTIEENTEEITDEVPLVVLEEKNGVYMIEYDKGEYEIVEAGILFGKNADVDVNSAYSKATVKNIKPHGQFTASPIANATASLQSNARGYVMYRDKNDNNKIKVIYSK